MPISSRSNLAAVALVALAAACGGAGGSGPSNGTTATALDYCTSRWNLFYDRDASCANAAPAFVAFNERRAAATVCAAAAHEVAAGRARFDAAKARSCLDALGVLDCAPFRAAFDDETYPPCAGVISGAAANGGTCFSDDDCAAGWCSIVATVCTGTCTAFAVAGQSCVGTSPCAPGFDCDALDVCTSLAGAGGACPCKLGLYCDGTGRCQAQKASGSACSSSGECASGLDCAGSTPVCQRFGGVGATCGGVGARCADGFHCGAQNTCEPDPIVGQACDARVNCIGGRCNLATSKCTACPAECADTCDPLSGACPVIACTIP
jgi:hypothetical protein